MRNLPSFHVRRHTPSRNQGIPLAPKLGYDSTTEPWEVGLDSTTNKVCWKTEKNC